MILSRVTPNWIEVVPEELLPTIPPIVQRFEVEVFGLKNKPKGFKYKLSSSLITPGSTVIVLFFLSKDKILVKYFEISTTIPSPTHWPANDVPAALGISVVLFFVAKLISFFKSSLSFG